MLKGGLMGCRSPKNLQGRVRRELQSDVALISKLGRKCPIGKKDGWAGEEAGRQAREFVILLERRVLSAEGWY